MNFQLLGETRLRDLFKRLDPIFKFPLMEENLRGQIFPSKTLV